MMPMITKENMIDGDKFEQLAHDLGLVYMVTHEIASRIGSLGHRTDNFSVLTHNSDGCILPKGAVPRSCDFAWESISSVLTHWFAQNADARDNRLTPIPIGLECNRWHPPSLKKDVILSIPAATSRELVYLNVTPRTSLRQALHEQFADKPWCTVEVRVDFQHFAQQLSTHKFTLSPDGNGMDCCRTWEALYLGSFPIVERHYFTEEFARQLPLLIVDDWSSITEGFLNHKYEELVNGEWNWKALEIHYWENLMRERI